VAGSLRFFVSKKTQPSHALWTNRDRRTERLSGTWSGHRDPRLRSPHAPWSEENCDACAQCCASSLRNLSLVSRSPRFEDSVPPRASCGAGVRHAVDNCPALVHRASVCGSKKRRRGQPFETQAGRYTLLPEGCTHRGWRSHFAPIHGRYHASPTGHGSPASTLPTRFASSQCTSGNASFWAPAVDSLHVSCVADWRQQRADCREDSLARFGAGLGNPYRDFL
jgi:hypothetical protein